MKKTFYTIGDRIAVKKIKQNQQEVNGMVVPFKGEKSGNVWGEIVALPETTENIWIKTLKIGDEILYKEFDTDMAVSMDNMEDFVVLEVQDNAVTKGQVMGVVHK